MHLPLQQHLMSSLHALDTSGTVIQIGTKSMSLVPSSNHSHVEMEVLAECLYQVNVPGSFIQS